MKYPTGIKKNITKVTNYKNRGMIFEELINDSNKYYLENNMAVIYKKPTPIQIVKTSFSTKGIKIVEAFFKEPSTTDYNGIYNGKYIDFEAKETISKTSFPLKNIHMHQVLHMENIINHKGIAFLLVSFVKLGRIYLLKGSDLINYVKNNDSKSIPLAYFEEKGYIIKNKLSPKIDYLEIVDKIWRY